MKLLTERIPQVTRLMCIAIAFWVAAGFTAFADVKGTIQDKEGEPIVGATVLVKGTQKGAAADLDGQFTLSGIDANATLLVSAVGYTPQEIALKGRTNITVTLLEDSKVLDDVVVIGYGSLQKKQVTSSITSIKGDDLVAGVGGSTIATALQGKIAGLSIDGNNSPNAGNSFQLRGVGSVNAGQSPLIVIDGVPGGDMRAIAQEDIESIDVLKDASAGAIYGTRAASGVILITTKKAKQGAVRVTYSGEFSTDFIRNKPGLMNAEEYSVALSSGGVNWGSNTDWYDAVTRNHPFQQQHMLTLQGGTDNLSVYSSLMYKDADGVVIGDNRKDYSGRINATYKLFDGKVELGVRLTAREADRDQRGGAGTVGWAMRMNPTIPLMSPSDPTKYNVTEDGAMASGGTPVANIMHSYNNGKDQWLLGTFTLKARLYDGLSLNASANVDRRQYQGVSYEDFEHINSIKGNKQGYAYHEFNKTNNVSYDAYLSYLKEFGANREHRIDATAGCSYWEHNQESFNASNSDFSVNGIGPWNLGEGSFLKEGNAGMGSSKSVRERLLSFFGRANYSYDDKYMVSASIRHEGSSKFGANHRWGTFWAVSGGWRISREEFMDDTRDWLSDLKIRVAYGVTGNNDFGTGMTVTRLTNDAGGWLNEAAGKWLPSYGPANNANPDLQWEEKKEFNVGLDFALFNDRVWGKFDWYTRDIDHLLFEVDAPQPPYVSNKIWRNVGEMQNRGWEIELGGNAIQTRDLTWTTTLNLSHNSGKIKKLGMEGQYLEYMGFPNPGNPGNAIRLTSGSPLGKFFVYRYAGVDENGQIQIYDKENNVVLAQGNALNSSNKTWVGNAFPAIIATWNNTVRYKDFDFGMQLRGWFDFDVMSQPSMYMGLSMGGGGNNLVKKLYEQNQHIKGDKVLCDYFINDGTFVKIDAINLGYTLNTAKWTSYLQKARFYLTLRDVARFTSYKGINPEVNINGLEPGFEKLDGSSLYPQTIHATFGVQLTF